MKDKSTQITQMAITTHSLVFRKFSFTYFCQLGSGIESLLVEDKENEKGTTRADTKAEN